MTLFPTFEKKLIDVIHPHDTMVVGVSGGVDSMALLHLLVRLAKKKSLKILVAHVNYKKRGQASDDDERFVIKISQAWGCSVFTEHWKEAEEKQNFQDAARDFRRFFFFRLAKEHQARSVVLGHHLQDQAETMLMHLMRGCGLTGMCGMSWKEMVQKIFLLRPLLDISRAEIMAYAESEKIPFREDESNHDISYKRNWVRHELLPMMEKYHPRVSSSLAQMSGYLAEDEEALLLLARECLREVTFEMSAENCVLSRALLSQYPTALRKRLLVLAYQQLTAGTLHVNADQLKKMDALVQCEEGEVLHYFLSDGWKFWRYRDRVVLGKEAAEV